MTKRSGPCVAAALAAALQLAAHASAQVPSGPQPEPEVRTCEAFTNRASKRTNPALLPVTIEWDRALRVTAVDTSVGKQRVATVLTGIASHATAGGRQETTFLCLIAKSGRAVFFHLGPEGTPVSEPASDPLKACLDTVGSRAGVDGCLAERLKEAETALDQAIAAKGRELESLDRVAGRSGSPAALAHAQRTWVAFRDAACKLEGTAAEAEASVAGFERACQVRLTLERATVLKTTQ